MSDLGVSAYLAGDTLVRTESGLCPLCQLTPGARVMVFCGGLAIVRAISVLSASAMKVFRPVSLTFSHGEILCLTEASRLLVASPWSELLFGISEATVPVSSLSSDPAASLDTEVDQPFYALHIDRPDFIYAGPALWLTPPVPVTNGSVVPFPQRAPRVALDDFEARLLHHYAGSFEMLLRLSRGSIDAPPPMALD